MLWLALLLPDLPLQVYTRGMAAAPLAVTVGHPRPQILAASAQARVLGVDAGQSVAAALAVAPALHLQTRMPALESETLAEVACWAGAFSPRISLAPPDAVLLEIETSLKLFGGAHAITEAIQGGITRLGLYGAIAMAPTPLAARWFARAGVQAAHATAADWRSHLDSLPLDLLADGTDVGPATLELLAGVGLRTLGEIHRLPRAGLARRQAGAVIDTLARARGEIPDPQRWFVPPSQYAQRIVLPAPVSHTEPLLFAARRLFAGLAAWLAARHAAVDHCRLALVHDRHPDTVVDIVSGALSRDEARLALLARERMARLELIAPVEELRLTADSPMPLAPHSDELFGHPGQACDNAILLLDRLRARLGTESVRLLEPCADHRPEAAWSSVSPALRSTARTGKRSAPPASPPRPLWLLPEPRMVDRDAITLMDGPERIEGGWWDKQDIRRDYYLARGPDEALWWVFCDLEQPGTWYVHGYFG
jgi:protein ImuB